MRKSTLWKLSFLMLLLSPLTVGKIWAQLENGKVYHFENKANTGRSLTIITDATNLTIATTATSDYKQLWYAYETTSGVYQLINLSNGKALCSPNATGNADWTTEISSSQNAQFSVTSQGNYYALRAVNTTDDYHFMHYGVHTNDIVCWSTLADASLWTITEVNVEQATLDEILSSSQIFNQLETYAGVQNLFKDKACTEFNKSYASESELEADEDYQRLPDALKNMAKKILSDNWEEANYDSANKEPWGSDYAKKYRVQLYEPYSEKEKAAAVLRINAHSNLNNPTGLFANSGQTLYVMVEGTIDPDALLYLDSYTGHGKPGGNTSGVQLKEGLNIINCTTDGSNYFINYNVKTFDNSNGEMGTAAKYRKLSEYPTLKIHIEGGHINGYYNKVGDALYTPDNNTTWEYIEERATQTDVTVLGKYIALQFPLLDENAFNQQGLGSYFNELVNVEDCINEWDNVMLWERLVMGILDEETIKANAKKSPYSDKEYVFEYTGNDTDGYGSDYSEYYNVHGLSFGTEGGYMYGGWDHCGYNTSTMGGVIQELPTSAGAHWGPGHEIGHQHQGPLNMRGLTEVTNNLFSNIVLWYYGETTSRYNGSDGALSNVLTQFNTEGSDFFSNNIWAQTIMYYKLFLYYHVLGHNPKFYPRLFEMLRQDPMVIEYDQDGSESLMHFYKKCCYAAGEDLTEFFRAHGFFEVMENRLVGDYSNAVYNLTQEQIDAAINEIKTWAENNNKKENLAVLFINDATNDPVLSHKGDDLDLYGGTTICAEVGNYATFSTAAEPSYSYSINGNTISMDGDGGIGFMILNEEGEIIGFSDKKTFTLSNEVMEQIANGEINIVSLSKSGNTVAAESAMSEDDITRTLLAELIEQGEAIMAVKDDTGTKIGYYRSSYTEEVEAALTKAQTVYGNQDIAAYTPAYNALREAIDNLKAQQYATNRMKPGTFILRNYHYNGHMTILTDSENLNKLHRSNITDEASLTDTEKWVFETASGEDNYYIKNLSTSTYLGELQNDEVMVATATEIADAAVFHVENIGNGVFRIICQTGDKKDLHCTGGTWIIGWSDGGGSRWYLTALETDELSAEQQALEELIANTEDLFENIAEVNKTLEAFDLGESNYYTNAPCTNTTYGDQFTSYSVLYDKNPETFLHSEYADKESADGLDHYLRIDLGAENSTDLFSFTYQARHNNSNQNPTAITVEGCDTENGTYKLIAKLTRDKDDLSPGAGDIYISDVLGRTDKPYRYLRFVVTATNNNAKTKGHVYFAFAEFGVSKVTCEIVPQAKYAEATDATYLKEVFNAIRQAQYEYNTAESSENYTSAYNTLKTYYDNLQSLETTTDSTNLTNKQEILEELIDKTELLIDSCGTVAFKVGEALTLSTTSGQPNYISDNNGSCVDASSSIENLLDSDVTTQYTTDWGSTPTEQPYLQVALEESLSQFTFTYTTRDSGGAPVPKKIVVSGSTDGSNFTAIRTFTMDSNGLPSTSNANQWTSPVVGDGTTAYTHLRFTVEDAYRSSSYTNSNGVCHYGISEFGISTIASYNVALTDAAEVTNVTNDILLSCWKENKSALQALTYATSEEQLDKAIEKLQVEYDNLYYAYHVLNKDELGQLITETESLIAECYEDEELKYPGSLYLTERIITAAENALTAARNEYNKGNTTPEDLGTATSTISTAKTNLAYALSHATLPVMVTTDVENPTLYKIRIKRTDTSLLELTSNNYVKVNSTVYAGDKNQTWLFMDNADKDGKVLILPYSKVAVENVELNTTTGSFTESNANKNWHKTWESTLYPGFTFNTTANNMQSENGDLSIAPSSNGCTWTLTAPSGYLIGSYGFKMRRSSDNDGTVKLTINGTEYTGTDELQPIDVTVNAAVATFSESGDNKKLTLEDFYVNLVPTESMLVLAANDLSDGADKVMAKAKDTEGYAQEWTISASEGSGCEGWFYISTTKDATTNYFSNNGGDTRWMGFWNFGDKKADGGSNFQFVEVDNSDFDNEAYNALYNYYTYDAKIESSEIVGSSNPGYYPTAQANAYNTAYAAATSALEAEPSVEADCYAAYAALKAANEDEALKINEPVVGTYYLLRSACSDDRGGKVMYSTKENGMYFSSEKTADNAEALWTITEEGYLYNLQNGICVSTVSSWGSTHNLGTDPQVVTINYISLDGKVTLTPGGGHPLHAQNYNSIIVGWLNEADNASAWRFEEVDLSGVTFPISVTKYGYAGLHLNYPVKVADGLEAYVVQEVTGEDGVARLTLLEDGIIPANTGVIVKSQEAKDAGETKEYTLNYYNTDATVDNLLDGRNYTQFVKAEPETDYYLFGVKNDEVGLYKAYEEYNSSGTKEQSAISEVGGTLDGVMPIFGNTYYLCNKQKTAGDVFFSIDNGAIAFNKEKKIDDNYRWLCTNIPFVTSGTETQSATTMAGSSQAMEIVIRNISGTNRWYFCGNKNVENPTYESVFIWEPAGDGNFYLKKKYPTANQGDGYLQTSAPSNMGAKATAQKFTAVYAYPSDAPESTADATNLVRFSCIGDNEGKWINCQGTGGTPVYNSGTGGFTMHNIYLPIETPAYVFKNVATGQYFAWQGLSNDIYNWALYDTVQNNSGDGLQDGCVSMKKVDGKYLVVENASGWDQADNDGFYNATYSSSFYFEKFETKNTSKTNDGGYFKCSANKIFLGYRATAGASKFLFRFDGGVTTDLEEALFGNDSKEEEIYDLQGRRVERITAPGLYIVNGKKRYVKAAKF